MKLIDSITDDANQVLTLVLDDGSRMELTLTYNDNQQAWFYSIAYGTIFTCYNRRMINSPNMLRAFRDVINFGLACTVNDGYEPVFKDDFYTGRAKLYTLNSDDVAYVEDYIIGNHA